MTKLPDYTKKIKKVQPKQVSDEAKRALSRPSAGTPRQRVSPQGQTEQRQEKVSTKFQEHLSRMRDIDTDIGVPIPDIPSQEGPLSPTAKYVDSIFQVKEKIPVSDYIPAKFKTGIDAFRKQELLAQPQKLPEGETVSRPVNYVTMPGVTGVPGDTMLGESEYIKEARTEKEARTLDRLQRQALADFEPYASLEEQRIASARPEDVDFSDVKLIAWSQRAVAASASNLVNIIGGVASTSAWKFHPLAGIIGSTLYFNYMYNAEKSVITEACLRAGIPRKYWEEKAHIYGLMAGFWEFSGTTIEYAMFFIGGRSISQMTAPLKNKTLRAIAEIAKGAGMEFAIEGTIGAWRISTLSAARADYQQATGKYIAPERMGIPVGEDQAKDQMLYAAQEGAFASVVPGLGGTMIGFLSGKATESFQRSRDNKFVEQALQDLDNGEATLSTDKLITPEEAKQKLGILRETGRRLARTKIQKKAVKDSRLNLRKAIAEKAQQYEIIEQKIVDERSNDNNTKLIEGWQAEKDIIAQDLIAARAKAWADVLASRRIQDPIQAKKDRDARIVEVSETDVKGRPIEIMEADSQKDKSGLKYAENGAIRVEPGTPYNFDLLTRLYQEVARRRLRRKRETSELSRVDEERAQQEAQSNALLAYEEVTSLQRSTAKYGEKSENQILDSLLTSGEIALFEQLQNKLNWNKTEIVEGIENGDLSALESILSDNQSTLYAVFSRKIMEAGKDSPFNLTRLFPLIKELQNNYPDTVDVDITEMKTRNPESLDTVTEEFLPLMVYEALNSDINTYWSQRSNEIVQELCEGLYDVRPKDISGTNFNWLFYFDINRGIKKTGYLNPDTNLFVFDRTLTGEQDYDLLVLEEWQRSSGESGVPVLLLGNNKIFVDGGRPAGIEQAATQYAEITGQEVKIETATEVSNKYGTDKPLDFFNLEERGVFQQRAWHGTRHPVLEGGKFSLDRVGTGTGAFGEGFGIYFAEEKTVGKAYRPDPELHLDGERITADWKHWDEFMEISSPISIAKESLLTAYSRGETENLINAAQKIAGEETFPFVEGTKQEEAQATKRKAIEWLEQNRDRISIEETGAIYEVDIPDNVKPRLMEWEGDTTQQTIDGETVYQKIRKGLIEKGLLTEENADNILPTQDTRGEALYKTLSKYFFDGDPKATSEFLASIGIPGNKYLDAGSRFGKQEGEPTYNFVIWDEGVLDRISTLKKNEQAMEDLSEEQATFYQRGVPNYNHAIWDTSFLEDNPDNLVSSNKKLQDSIPEYLYPLNLGTSSRHLHIGSDIGYPFHRELLNQNLQQGGPPLYIYNLTSVVNTSSIWPSKTKKGFLNKENKIATAHSQGGQADTVTVLLDEVTNLDDALAVAADACSRNGRVAFIGERTSKTLEQIEQYFEKTKKTNGILLASEPVRGDFQLQSLIRWKTNKEQNVYTEPGIFHISLGITDINTALNRILSMDKTGAIDPFIPIASLLKQYTNDQFKEIPVKIDPTTDRAYANREGIWIPDTHVPSRTLIHEIGHMLGLKKIDKEVNSLAVEKSTGKPLAVLDEARVNKEMDRIGKPGQETVTVNDLEGQKYLNALEDLMHHEDTSPGIKTFIELYLKTIEHSEEYLTKIEAPLEVKKNVTNYINTEDPQHMEDQYLYGLANLHEFLASAISFPDLMGFLGTFEGVRNGPSNISAMDDMKNTFTKFIVGEERSRGSLSVSPTQRMAFQELIERVFFIAYENKQLYRIKGMTAQAPFEQINKGRVTFTRDGRAIMEFFRNADIDTPPHELAHVFFTTLGEHDIHSIADYLSGKVSEANPQGRTISAETLIHWVNDPASYPNLSPAQQKDITIAQEYFANNFVRYLREGKAPTPKLRMLLGHFNDELKRIYKNIADIPLAEKPISKPVRRIYDKMLDAEAALEAPKKYVRIDGVRYTVNRSKGRTYDAQVILNYLGKAEATIQGIKHKLWQYAAPLRKTHPLEVEALIERVKTKEDVVPTMDKLDRIEATEVAQIQEKKIRALRDTLNSIELNRIPQRYADAIKELLSDISLRRSATNQKKTEIAEQTAQYIRQYYEKHGREPHMPQDVLNNVEDLGKKSIYEMDPEEVQILHEMIKHYEYLALTKSKIRQLRLLKKLDKAITEARGSIREHGELGEPRNYDLKGLQKWKKWGKWFLWDRTKKVENLLFYMDGNERGPLTEIFFDNFNRAKDRRDSITGDFEREIQEWIAEIYFDPRDWSKAMQIPYEKFNEENYIKIPGMLKSTPKNPTPTEATMKITKAQRIALYIYSLNRNAKRHLLEGALIDRDTPTAKWRFKSEHQLYNVLRQMTPEEVQFAKKVLAYYENVMKPLINEVSVSLVGYELATEENYFPLFVEWLTRKQGEALYKADLNTQVESFLRKIIERSGFLQERTEAVNPIYLPDVFEAMHDNVHEASLYVAYAEPLRIAKAVLWDAGQEPSDETGGAAIPGFIQLTRDSKWGDIAYNSLKEHVTKIEGDIEFTVVSERMGRKALENMTYAILGWNISTAAFQPVSYLMIFNEMDARYAMKGIKTRLSSLKESIEEMSRLDPELRKRFQGYLNKDVGEIASRADLRQTIFGKNDLITDIKNWREVGLKAALDRAIKGHSLDWLKLQDARTLAHIYEAVKVEQAELHPNASQAEMWDLVRKRMRYLVRQTQPIYNIQDRPEAFNSRNFVDSLLVKFMTQLNSNRNQAEKAYRMWKAGKITGAQATMRIVNATAINSMAVGTIRRILSGLGRSGKGAGEEGFYEDDELSWGEKRLVDILSGVGAQYPAVRVITDAAATQIEYGTFVSSQRRGLFAEVFIETGQGLGQIIQGSPREDALTEEEWTTRLVGLMRIMEQVNNTLIGYAPNNIKKIYNTTKGFGKESVELLEEMEISMPSFGREEISHKLPNINLKPKENK